MLTYSVMLKPTWQGVFSRTIQVAIGGGKFFVERLQFAHNEPVECTAEQLTSLRSDIGKSLCVARFDDKGRPRPDWDKTQRLVEGERIEDVFADAPPIVTGPPAAEEDAFPIEESLIPEKYHSLLKKHQLPTLQSIALYLENHDDLRALDGVGEKANKEILEALEAHNEDGEETAE